jgi:hypothetical protein
MRYLTVLFFGSFAFAYIELPLVRRQQLQGSVEVSGLNTEHYHSINASSAIGLCFLTLDIKNCSSQNNLGTVIGLGTPGNSLL